jgi:hypothetical protein
MDVADSAGLSSHYPKVSRLKAFAYRLSPIGLRLTGFALDRVAFCAIRVSPQLPPIPVLARDGETLTLEDCLVRGIATDESGIFVENGVPPPEDAPLLAR